MNISEVLEKIGLSNKAALVYGVLLSGESCTANLLAEKTRISRSTVYDILHQLQNDRLVYESTDEGCKIFSAMPPTALRDRIRDLEILAATQRNKLEEVLPFLQTLYDGSSNRPKLSLFEGVDGLMRVRERFLSLTGDVIQLVPADVVDQFEVLVKDRPEHFKKMLHTGFYRGLVVTKDVKKDFSKIEHGEIRVLAADKFPLNAEITVREDSVFIFSYARDIVAVELKSSSIVGAFLCLFELAWQSAKK